MGDSSLDQPPPAPCTHDDGPANKIALGIHDERTYRICAKGIGERKIPNDPKQRTAVCPCDGCGPGCSSYEADTPDVEAPGREPLRHLLFHVMPVAHHGTWQRCLDQLLMRWPLFTGRKVIAIVTRSETTTREISPPEEVKDYLSGRGCEFIEVPNNPDRREVETWGPLWEAIRPDAEHTDDAVFYAHAKGVTRPFDPGNSCHPWARLMFSALLDYWPLVERSLKEYPITGILKKVGFGFASRSQWHYSGSFFWIRAAEAFKYDRVKLIDQTWWGNESWPGVHFPPEHAGCVFHEGRVPGLDMYDPAYVERVVEEFRIWASENLPFRSAIG